jgi:hypothetical protein
MPTRKSLLTLVFFLVGGALIFSLALFLLLTIIGAWGGVKLDSSVLGFYPIMAGCGAIFGFERWLANQQGPYNPFHDQVNGE